MTIDGGDALTLFLRGTGMGTGLGLMLAIMRMIFGRLDKREAHLDEATKELINELRKELDRLKKRCEESEERMRECERKHAETEAEMLGLKRLLQASGEVRQMAQQVVSADRLFDKRKDSE